MRNKLLIGILSIVLFTCIAASALTAAYAWLTPGQPVAFDAKGNAIAGYFHGGTGTADDPYILTRPKHLYNLAWLQYLGTFNVTDENGNLKQFFFKLANDIDMENSPYRVLPPIGTTLYPFVGYFNGNNKTISNAIVANIIDPANNQISEFPPALLQEGSDRQNALQNVEIIGFFGVIGEYEEGSLGFTLTDEQLEYLGVEDLLLKNVAVQTSTDKSLAGLVAGFVNGNLTNVYVSSGIITARPDATTLMDYNVLSSYSLIGNYETTKINWIGGPLDGPTSTSGTNAGFGGSIDMLSLAKRMTYMMKADSTIVDSYYNIMSNTVSKNNHAYAGTASLVFDYDYNNNLANGKTRQTLALFFMHGKDSSGNSLPTYVPLNIDLSTLQQSSYTKTSSETVKEGNTGYIVGKYYPGYFSTSAGRTIKPLSVANRMIGQLSHSVKGNITDWKNLNYTETVDKNLQILTKDSEGNYYVIADTYNGLTNETGLHEIYANVQKETENTANPSKIGVKSYKTLGLTQYLGDNNVRGKLGEMLISIGKGDMFGLNFGTASPTATKPAANATANDRANAGVITFENGEKVSLGDIEVPSLVQDSVHFALESDGVITMVLATVGVNDQYLVGENPRIGPQNHRLPMLYQVLRDEETQEIIKLEPISVICKDSKGNISYNDSLVNYKEPTGKTVCYNVDTMGVLTTNQNTTMNKACMQSLFYFELPVLKGEYVMGSVGGGSSVYTYLLYLDIGANAGDSSSTPPSSGGSGSVADPTGELTGVYFVDANGNPILQDVIPDEGKTAPAVAFEIKLNTTTGVSVSFEGTETGVNVAITPTNGATAEQVKMKKEEETTGS